MTEQPYEDYQFTYAGVLLGPDSAYEVTSISGLEDLPGLRTADTLIPGGHGAFFSGADLLEPRTIDLSLTILGGSDADMAAKVAALGLITAPRDTELPLRFKLPGKGVRRLAVRPRARSLPIDIENYMYNTPTAMVRFTAPDPRIYDETEQTATLTAGHSVTITNAGSFETCPVVRFSGTSGTVTLRLNGTQPFTFTYTTSGSETITADFLARTLRSSTTGGVYAAKVPSSRWWSLPPGASTLTLTGSGSAQVQWRNAWV